MSDETKFPCVDCICMPICRNKPIIKIFHDCQLINNFLVDYVDHSSNREIAVDIVAMCNIMNETLNRYLVPYFKDGDLPGNMGDRIGFVDIRHKRYSKDLRTERIINTYRIFRRSFNVDMLEMPRIKPYLLPIVRDMVNSIEGFDN